MKIATYTEGNCCHSNEFIGAFSTIEKAEELVVEFFRDRYRLDSNTKIELKNTGENSEFYTLKFTDLISNNKLKNSIDICIEEYELDKLY